MKKKKNGTKVKIINDVAVPVAKIIYGVKTKINYYDENCFFLNMKMLNAEKNYILFLI